MNKTPVEVKKSPPPERWAALVHSPYSFDGPHEVTLPPRREAPAEGPLPSWTPSLAFPGPASPAPVPTYCTSGLCNARLGFHVHGCAVAQRLAPLPPPPPSP
eukprot:EG_transcript_17201